MSKTLREILEKLCREYHWEDGVGCSHQFDQAIKDIKALVPEKHKLVAILNDNGEKHFSVPDWVKFGENRAIDETQKALGE